MQPTKILEAPGCTTIHGLSQLNHVVRRIEHWMSYCAIKSAFTTQFSAWSLQLFKNHDYILKEYTIRNTQWSIYLFFNEKKLRILHTKKSSSGKAEMKAGSMACRKSKPWVAHLNMKEFSITKRPKKCYSNFSIHHTEK